MRHINNLMRITCLSLLMFALVEHSIETHTVNPSSQNLATATFVVKNSTVYLSETKEMRMFFLITANRNITLLITVHQCKMSAHINKNTFIQ